MVGADIIQHLISRLLARVSLIVSILPRVSSSSESPTYGVLIIGALIVRVLPRGMLFITVLLRMSSSKPESPI